MTCSFAMFTNALCTRDVDEHHDQLYDADDAVVLDENSWYETRDALKAGVGSHRSDLSCHIDDLADVETRVESTVQVYAKVMYTIDRLDVDTIDVDADSSRLTTL